MCRPTRMTEKFSIKARLHSIRYALNGLKILWSEQHNARVHLLITLFVMVLALILRMPLSQWPILLLLIAIVWVAEALNSAIEYLCDKVTLEQDPLIGKAKDVAAAGVLIASVIAACGGLFLFLPLVFAL